MIPLLASPAAQRLAWTLLHFLWQGALLGLLAWAAFALLRRQRPQLRYVAGCAFLFACLSAALVTYAVLSPAPAPIAAGRAPAPPIVDLQANLVPSEIAAPVPMASPWGLPQTLARTLALPWRDRLQPYLPWILAAWAVGVFSLGLRAVGGWLWLRRLKATATPATEPEWLEALVRRVNLRRVVRFLESARVATPLCMGLLRPVVLLPFGFFANLDPLAAEAVLAHELAHLRRLDGLVNGFQCVIEVLFFFHPAVWWISRRIRTEREHCCDDAAVLACGDAVFYAETLSRLDALRDRPPSLALSARGGNLMERLRRLLLADPPQLRFATPGLALVVALALIGSLPAQAEKAEVAKAQTDVITASPEPPATEILANPLPAGDGPFLRPDPLPTRGNENAVLPLAPGQVVTPTPTTTPITSEAPTSIASTPVSPQGVKLPNPAATPSPAPSPGAPSTPVFQAQDLAIVPGVAIRTLRVPQCPAIIVDELLTWPNKGYAVEVPAHTTVSVRIKCESGEAYFRIRVADKWGNSLPGTKGSLGTPWASFANASSQSTAVIFFVQTGQGYPGDGKINVHVTATREALQPMPTHPTASEVASPGSRVGTGKPSLDEAHQLISRLAAKMAWGATSNIVIMNIGELTHWNGAFTEQFPEQTEKKALIQAIPKLDGWEITYAVEPIDEQKAHKGSLPSNTVLLDKDGVLHWRKPWPRLPPGLDQLGGVIIPKK